MAAINYILTIDGIPSAEGNSVQFEVLSFSIGVSHSAAANGGGSTGRGAGKSTFQDLVVVKRLDKSSPALFLASASGRLLPEATLSLLPAVQVQGDGGTGELIGLLFKYTLGDVQIASVKYNGNELGDSVPLEELSLNFTKIKVSYGNQ